MEALLLLIMGAYGIGCFMIGVRVRQKVDKGEDIKLLPDVSLAEKIQQRREKKQAQMEQDRLETIMRNIEGYDGTGRGQEDVP